MAEDPFASEDFDKLLDDFISSQLQDTEDALAELHDQQNSSSDTLSDNAVSVQPEDNAPAEENTVFSSILGQINEPEKENLALEEKRLYNAYKNLIASAFACADDANIKRPGLKFSIDELMPRFRPSRVDNLNQDILSAWEILIEAQPIRLTSLPPNASDEQILNFAEKTTDKNLQMALISYVEVLIELDACEAAYNLRKIRYKKHQLEKKIFEEQQERKNKMRKYINAIKKKNFPVDAEQLVNNFFKTARKDLEGAKKLLETSPATFAPIQFEKIPAKFFGMIKAKPEDGIKINKKMGKFLKNLKA